MRALTERLTYIQESVGADKVYIMLENDKLTVQVLWIAGNSVIPFTETYDSSALKSSLDIEETFISDACKFYLKLNPFGKAVVD